MLLLLLVNFVTGFGLKLIHIYICIHIHITDTYTYIIAYVRSGLTHLQSPKSNGKFRQSSNCCERALEVAKLVYGNKRKESITFHKLGCQDFWRIPVSVLNKDKSAIPPLLNGPEVLFSLFAENISEKSNLDESVISLPVFHSRTNLKLHNYALTSVIVTKVITNLDLSKVSGPDCIPVVVLMNYGPEISYMLAELFNECLRQSCFPVLKCITDGPCT